jgi:hypothetical protein
MPRLLKNQLIRGYRDQNSGATFCDYEFVQCRFEHCFLGALRDPSRRPTARRISLLGCSALRCHVIAPILEDIMVNGLDSEANLILWAPAFRHVTIAGPICNLMVNIDEDPAGELDPINAEFRKANANFYSTVDWALDISKAEFSDVSIRGVPAGLVRRDPESQVVIQREKVLGSRWKEIPLSGTHWATEIEWFLDRGEADHVLIAPKRSKTFKKLLDGLRLLQKEGVAEPD